MRDSPHRSKGSKELQERLALLSLQEYIAPSASHVEAEISGRRFQMQDNEDGIRYITLDFNGDSSRLVMEDERGSHAVTAGMGRWIEGSTSMTGNRLHHEYQMEHMRVAANGHWLNQGTLVLTRQFVETAFRDTVTCYFQDNTLRFDRSVNVNTGPLQRPTIRGVAIS